MGRKWLYALGAAQGKRGSMRPPPVGLIPSRGWRETPRHLLGYLDRTTAVVAAAGTDTKQPATPGSDILYVMLHIYVFFSLHTLSADSRNSEAGKSARAAADLGNIKEA